MTNIKFLKEIVDFYLQEKYRGDFVNLNILDKIDSDPGVAHTADEKIQCAIEDLELFKSSCEHDELIPLLNTFIENIKNKNYGKFYIDYINHNFNFYLLNKKIDELIKYRDNAKNKEDYAKYDEDAGKLSVKRDNEGVERTKYLKAILKGIRTNKEPKVDTNLSRVKKKLGLSEIVNQYIK